MSNTALPTDTGYQALLSCISEAYPTGQLRAHQPVNVHLTQTYAQNGHGKGFSLGNAKRFRQIPEPHTIEGKDQEALLCDHLQPLPHEYHN